MLDRVIYYIGYTLPSCLLYLFGFIIAEQGFKRKFGSLLLKPSTLLIVFLVLWGTIIAAGVVLGEKAINPITDKAFIIFVLGVVIWLVCRILPRPHELVNEKDETT